jgi:hypothetical protein
MSKCETCGIETKNKHFCSRKCVGLSSSKKNNELHPNKKPKRERVSMKCSWDECDNIIERVKDDTDKLRFCSNGCHIKWQNKHQRLCELGGNIRKKLGSTNRSKNEIAFADLCKDYFKNVRTNETIFNGFDADVIIDDLKVAVLWNGIWHYQKVTKTHSLLQVQNRDKIKIDEIKKMGYEPYIVRDMGKYNLKFVENEFERFLKEYNC